MKSPSGKLRFRAPVEPEAWIDEFDATKDCPSFPIFDMMTQKIVGIEDAGRVNVFTKNVNPSKLYPVLVYVSRFIQGRFRENYSCQLLCNKL